jgi:hypothetical protein
MSDFQQQLSALAETKIFFDIQLRNLERLRAQVKKAQLSARRSPPKSRRKRTRIGLDVVLGITLLIGAVYVELAAS